MTQPVTNTNVAFAGQALKYMQNGTLKERSLFDDVKSTAAGALPFALIADTIPTLWGAKKIKKAEGGTFKQALEKKTAEKLKSQNVPKEHGKIAKFFKLDKLSKWYNGTKFAGTKLGRLFKGSSSMFLFTGLFELMEVIPAFKNGGIGAGLKQTVKSAGNVVVDGLMYTAGLKLGTAAGAAIGGPVGAVVGGIGGMVLGGVLNTLGRGLLDKVLGKNYSVKKQEQDMQAQAQAIAQDSAALAQVKDAVQAQILTKAQNGEKITEDDKQMLAMAQAVEAENPQMVQNEQNVQSLAQANNIQAAQTQTANMTPEEQEEAELIARLQKVDNPQIEYQIPDNFSVDA
ncbi:hypothetical protein IJC60_05305 [bacterium]|nr:hypothetical protein [bacterium]